MQTTLQYVSYPPRTEPDTLTPLSNSPVSPSGFCSISFLFVIPVNAYPLLAHPATDPPNNGPAHTNTDFPLLYLAGLREEPRADARHVPWEQAPSQRQRGHFGAVRREWRQVRDESAGANGGD